MSSDRKKTDGTPAPREGSQSIRRAIAIIRAVSTYGNDGVRLTQVANDVDLHVATVHRILGVLNEEGLIGYDRSSRRYFLGVELFALGTAANQFKVRNLFRPAIEKIAKVTEETVFLVLRLGDDSLCIDRLEGSSPIRIMPYAVGTQTPLGVGAGALALLFGLEDKEVRRILDRNSNRYRQYNAGGPKTIWKAVEKARERGFAVSRGLYMDGVGGVGRPAFRPGDKIEAAISVCSLTEKLDHGRCRWIASVIAEELKKLDGEIGQVTDP